MIYWVSEKAATPSSFSEVVKNALENYFPFTISFVEKLMTLSLKELKQFNS